MTSDFTINTITQSEALNQQGRTETQKSQLNQDFDDFLLLLTTQLQNQDPLDPVDTKEFTNQLVQFSQVEQQINTNQKLDSLVQRDIVNSTAVAFSFVGNDITYPSTEAHYNGERDVKISYNMPETSVFTAINIRDDRGNLVFSQPVSGEVGANDFVWDGSHSGGGTVDPGTYSFTIDALNTDGEAIADINSIVTGVVSGVEAQDGQVFFLVGDRAVKQEDVLRAYSINSQPTTVTETEEAGEGDGAPADQT